MRKFYTQTFYIMSLRFISLFFLIVTLLLGIFISPNAYIFILFLLFMYSLSFIYKINKILVDDRYIDVQVIFCKVKYLKDELKEITIRGNNLKYGMSCVDLQFYKEESQKWSAVRTQRNLELLRELLKDYNGKITFLYYKSDTAKKQLITVGAKPHMFK